MPQAPVIAVNGAANEVQAFALFSLHPERFAKWTIEQRQKFGAGFTTHTGGQRDRRLADYVWPGASGAGTSAWAARKMAWMMGFDPVVLVGVPLEPGGYAHTSFSQFWHDAGRVQFYRDYIERDQEWHDGVYSMSGWTRSRFGEPRKGII